MTNVSFAPSGGVLFSTANDGNIIEWRVVLKAGNHINGHQTNTFDGHNNVNTSMDNTFSYGNKKTSNNTSSTNNIVA